MFFKKRRKKKKGINYFSFLILVTILAWCIVMTKNATAPISIIVPWVLAGIFFLMWKLKNTNVHYNPEEKKKIIMRPRVKRYR